MKLSTIIPVYNEKDTILKILEKIEAVVLPFEREIIIVDDGSTDGTKKIVESLKDKYKVILHEENQGKGSAIRTGIREATGDIILIQDADLEYDPQDYPSLIEPISNGRESVVYGSRNLKKNKKSTLIFYLGGKFLSWLSNLLYKTKITDEATCYKVFKADVLKSIPLECKKFEFCPEVTAKVALAGYQIHEVPISYYPRLKQQGKKISWGDGWEASLTLIKYRWPMTAEFIKGKKSYLFIFLLALLNLMAIYLVFGWQSDRDTVSYVKAINYIMGDGEIGNALFRLIKPVGLWLAAIFQPLTGAENALIVENILFYFGSAFVIFKLAKQVFGDNKKSHLAVVFFLTAYPVLRWGLAALTDMGGWFFYLLSLYIAVLFFTKRRVGYIYLSGLVSGLGLLLKETGGVAALFFVSMLLLENLNWKERFAITLRYSMAFLAVVLPISFFIFFKFGYSFYHWFVFNQEIQFHYSFLQSALYAVENVFSIMFLAWFFVIRGVYLEFKERENPRRNFYLALILPSLSFLIWPFRLVRMMFIAGPLLCLLAAQGATFKSRKAQVISYVAISLVLVFNFSFPKLVDLSLLQDILDKIL